MDVNTRFPAELDLRKYFAQRIKAILAKLLSLSKAPRAKLVRVAISGKPDAQGGTKKSHEEDSINADVASSRGGTRTRDPGIMSAVL